jgi:hypothetical protein
LGAELLDVCGATPLMASAAAASDGEDYLQGSSGGSGTSAPEACPDISLARHAAALRAALEPHSSARDELLRTLLAAALLHQADDEGDEELAAALLM